MKRPVELPDLRCFPYRLSSRSFDADSPDKALVVIGRVRLSARTPLLREEAWTNSLFADVNPIIRPLVWSEEQRSPTVRSLRDTRIPTQDCSEGGRGVGIKDIVIFLRRPSSRSLDRGTTQTVRGRRGNPWRPLPASARPQGVQLPGSASLSCRRFSDPRRESFAYRPPSSSSSSGSVTRRFVCGHETDSVPVKNDPACPEGRDADRFSVELPRGVICARAGRPGHPVFLAMEASVALARTR